MIDHFSIEADAPAAPDDVRASGVLLTDGITIEDGVSLPLRWHAGDSARGDLNFIDVSGARGAAIRCAFKDAGEAVVLYCAICGSYVVDGAPQRLRKPCPRAPVSRAAARSLRRIGEGLHPNTRSPRPIGRPWQVAIGQRASGQDGQPRGAAASHSRGGEESAHAGSSAFEPCAEEGGQELGGLYRGFDSP